MPPFLLPLISIVAGLIKSPGAVTAKVSDVVKSPKRAPSVKETVIGYAILAAIAAGASQLNLDAAGIQSALCSAPAPVAAPQPSELEDEL